MTKKPREKRVPIMMTEEEQTAIDDWRFANKIATRSDAIRRLCKMALVVEDNIEEAVDSAIKLASGTKENLERVRQLAIAYRNENPQSQRDYLSEIRNILEDDLDWTFATFQAVDILHLGVLAIWNGIAPYGNSANLDEATKESEWSLEQTRKIFAEMQEEFDKREFNRRLGEVMTRMSKADETSYEALSEDEKDAFLEREVEKLRRQEEAEEVEQ